MRAKPLDFGGVFEKTWERFKSRFGVFIGLYFTGLVAIGLSLGLAAGLFFGLKAAGLGVEVSGALAGLLALAALVFVGGQFLNAWYQLAVDDRCGFGDALSRSRGKALGTIGVTLLPGLACMGGLFFCLFPALLVAAAFAFAPYVYVAEGVGGPSAAFKSFNLMRRNFWLVVLFVLIAY